METIKECSLYYECVMQDFLRVQKFFPLLQITILPTTLASEITIDGYLLPPEMNSVANDAIMKTYGLKIHGCYPYNFPAKSLKVWDVDNRINWEKIPERHTHIYPYDGSLCTHHPSAEINDIPEPDQTIAILFSAWQLFYQAKTYIEEGRKWTLKDLPHGDQGTRILKREGRI